MQTIQHLQGEHEILRTRAISSPWIVRLIFVILLTFLLSTIWFLAFFLWKTGTFPYSDSGFFVTSLVVLVILLAKWWGAIVGYREWKATIYVLTDRRIFSDSGVDTRSSNSLMLDQIQQVDLEQHVDARRRNYGDLNIRSSGGGMQIYAIPAPMRFRQAILEAMSANQMSRHLPASIACPYCGSMNLPRARFCSACGRPI